MSDERQRVVTTDAQDVSLAHHEEADARSTPRSRRNRSSARPGRNSSWRSSLAAAAVGFALLVVTWELVARLSGLDKNTLPGAGRVLTAMASLTVNGEYLRAVWTTLWGASLGLSVAVLVGVPLGVLLGSSAVTYRATIALIDLLRPIPAVALIPAVVLFFGAGLEMKVFLVAFSVIWTIMLNTVYAVRDVDPVLKETARIYHFNRRQVLRRVVLPSAAPFIYTGLRIGTIAALIVTIASELLTGGGGLGSWLAAHQQAVTLNHLVYAGALLSGVVGVGLNTVLNVIERRAFAWHASVRETVT